MMVLPSTASGIKYQYLGCFEDNNGDRTLTYYKNIRNEINWRKWPDLTPTINKCARVARKKRYIIFAVQHWGECWEDKSDSKNYAKHDKSDSCYNGVGSASTNAVYRLLDRKYLAW